MASGKLFLPSPGDTFNYPVLRIGVDLAETLNAIWFEGVRIEIKAFEWSKSGCLSAEGAI